MCCGRTVVTNQAARRVATPTGWVVTYPDGKSETKTSEIAARLAAGRVTGATYARAS